jgi:xylan 1,4-beta-xylosidase
VSALVIPGFFSDPSICRGRDAYYTAHSSFEYVPGVPIFRSTDLLTWTQVGNALSSPRHLPPTSGSASSGIHAPTIRFADGRFWLVTTDIDRVQRGHFIVSAEDPAGPWSEPAFVSGSLGIDPDLMWDDDGVCRLTWKSFHPANAGILSAPIDPVAGVLLAEPERLWQGTGMSDPEGPHLYRIWDWWYLLLAEGGTERGHTVTIARARELSGPWETPPVNPILTHRSTDHPIQNVGHADLVEAPDGSWAMVYHGVRAQGQTPKFHVNGRETFLAGVTWVDGWPIIDESRFEVSPSDHSFVDTFESEELDPRWVSPGVDPSSLTEPSDGGGLRLDASKAVAGGACLVATRTRDEEWTAEARLSEVSGTCRLIVRMDAAQWFGVVVTATEVKATLAIGPAVTDMGSVPRTEGDLHLRISARPAPSSPMRMPEEPDLIELAAIGSGGAEHVFGAFEGRYLSTEVAGGFTGRLVGVEVVEGSATLRQLAYRSDRI